MCTLVDEMIVSKVWTVKQLSLYRHIHYHKGTIVNYLQQKKKLGCSPNNKKTMFYLVNQNLGQEAVQGRRYAYFTP